MFTLFILNPLKRHQRIYAANCDFHGDGYINLPDSTWCLRLDGEVRVRYQVVSKLNEELESQINARGRIIVDGRNQSELGPIRTYIRISGDTNDETTFDDGFVQINNFSAGKTDSFGNLTYGSYAMNANHKLYHAENSTAQFGYSFEIGESADISISLENLTSEMPYINFDLGTSAEMRQNWGTVGIASGVFNSLP